MSDREEDNSVSLNKTSESTISAETQEVTIDVKLKDDSIENTQPLEPKSKPSDEIETEQLSKQQETNPPAETGKRELKLLLALSKEANLDTNLTHKRRSQDPNAKLDSNILRTFQDSGLEENSLNVKSHNIAPNEIINSLSENEEGKETKDPKESFKLAKRKVDSTYDSGLGGAASELEIKTRKLSNNFIIMVNNKKKDSFCWQCHHEQSKIHCETCPRSYHPRCLKQSFQHSSRFICPECVMIMKAENLKERSPAMQSMTLEHLCGLLKFALKRMLEVSGCEPFIHPVSENEFPEYKNYIVQPMDLTCLEKNIKGNIYGSTQAFESDSKWILHNSIIFNSFQSKLTSVAKSMLKICKQEMAEIENCANCYLNANTKKKTWFVEVCPKPHLLVWAKLRGFPFWPAKAMRSNNNNMVDVRFFGAHDRAWIPHKEVFLFSAKDPNSNKQKRHDINESIKEVKVYIENLKKMYGDFQYAEYKINYDIDHELEQLQLMLPNYNPSDPHVPKPSRRTTNRRNTNTSLLNCIESDETVKESTAPKSVTSEDPEKNVFGYDSDGENSNTSQNCQYKLNNCRSYCSSKASLSEDGDSKDTSLRSEVSSFLNPNETSIIETMDNSSLAESSKNYTNFKLNSDSNDSPNKSQNIQQKSTLTETFVDTLSPNKSRISDILLKKFAEPQPTSTGSNDANRTSSGNVDNSVNMENIELISYSTSKTNDEIPNKNYNSTSKESNENNEASTSLIKDNLVLDKQNIPKNAIILNNNYSKVNEDVSSDSESLTKSRIRVRQGLKRRFSEVSESVSEFSDNEKDEESSSQDNVPAVNFEKMDCELSTNFLVEENTDRLTENASLITDSSNADNSNAYACAKRRKPDHIINDDETSNILDSDFGKNENDTASTSILESRLNSGKSPPAEKTEENIQQKSKSNTETPCATPVTEKSEDDIDSIVIKDEPLSDDEGLHDNRESKIKYLSALNISEKPKQSNAAISKNDESKCVDNLSRIIDDVATNRITSTLNANSNTNSVTKKDGHITSPKSSLSNKQRARKTFPISEVRNTYSAQKRNLQEKDPLILTKTSTTSNAFKNVSTSIIVKKSVNASNLPPNQPIIYSASRLNPTLTVMQQTPIYNQTSTVVTPTNMVISPNTPNSSRSSSNTIITESQNYIPQSGATTKPVSNIINVTSGQKNTESSPRSEPSNIPALAPLTVHSPSVNGASELANSLQLLNSHLSEPLNKAVTDLVFRRPPKLKPRPPGPLSNHFEEGLPSSAGSVTNKINSISHRLNDYFRGMLVELLQEVGSNKCSEAEIVRLKLEIEQLKHKHAEEIMDIKKSVSTVLQDVQNSIASEQARLVEETRSSCEAESLKRVEEAKSKQWCANCSKEAQFYCCWNTSYCDYPCQQMHWPKHMSNCTQNIQKAQQAQGTGVTNNAKSPSQGLIFRQTSKTNTAKTLIAKPTKFIVNRTSNAKNYNFSPGNHITLVESTPGSYELVGNGGPIAVGGKFLTNVTKVKTSTIATISSPSSTSDSVASTGQQAFVISRTKPVSSSAVVKMMNSPMLLDEECN